MKLVFHHEQQQLPVASDDVIPVLLYGRSDGSRHDISHIGNPLIDKIKRLGVSVSSQAMDFLTIALAVTAADTFVQREKEAADGWSRNLILELPLHDPNRWIPLKKKLEEALHFLSGDIWTFDFKQGGYKPPHPYGRRYKKINLRGLDCVSLFSGGLDSAIGAIDHIEDSRCPLLISHGYTFDKGKQDVVANKLRGNFGRLQLNAAPYFALGKNEITMRTRSLNFIAFAVIGASALQQISQLTIIDLYIPENGFISLNAPLTHRRVGSLSTRTTHPHFVKEIQTLFDSVGIPCKIINPYQFKTKGQMVLECQNQALLNAIVDDTVSCSHWKREKQQCGVCVPCSIRRAALLEGGITDNVNYAFNDITSVLNEEDRRDDLMALSISVGQKGTRNIGSWISDSGPLDTNQFPEYKKIFIDGLDEIEKYLILKGLL